MKKIIVFSFAFILILLIGRLTIDKFGSAGEEGFQGRNFDFYKVKVKKQYEKKHKEIVRIQEEVPKIKNTVKKISKKQKKKNDFIKVARDALQKKIEKDAKAKKLLDGKKLAKKDLDKDKPKAQKDLVNFVDDIKDCIGKSNCRQSLNGVGFNSTDGQFAHDILGNSLEALVGSLGNPPQMTDELQNLDTLGLMDVDNSRIRDLAGDLNLLQGDEKDMAKALDKAKSWPGEDALDLLQKYSEDKNVLNNKGLVDKRNDTLLLLIEKANRETLYHISKKLPSLNLSSSDGLNVLRKFCPHRAMNPQAEAWKRIERKVGFFAQDNGHNLNQVCR